jgi:transposase
LSGFQGGFNCRIHALTDALGLPMRFILAGGQAADITQATPLMQDTTTGALLADKGYDANALEGMFGKLKYFCRVATRYEKKASHFMEMLTFGSVLLWLR